MGTEIRKSAKPYLELPTGCEERSIHPRRLLGVYYTPDSLAEVLTDWALPGKGNVLDPSFGGCAFLSAATRVLAKKGVIKPGKKVFGVDVDPTCMENVRKNRDLLTDNCFVKDFLSLEPQDLPESPFDAVVGNPPYVRHHWFNGSTRKAGREVVSMAEIKLPATASAWTYFLIHSLNFIAKNGRLAMLVPEAILQADYANSVKDLLKSRFSQVSLVHVRERQFKGTEEAVIVVAASGYGRKTTAIRFETVKGVPELAAFLNGNPYSFNRHQLITDKGRKVDLKAIHLLNELEQHHSVMRIAEFASVRIGLVTGSNKHFIRSKKNLLRLRIHRDSWIRLIPRTRWLSGLVFTESDHEKLVQCDQRAILICPPPRYENTSGIRQWINEGMEVGIDVRQKCSVRDPWFRVSLQSVPDAFCTCTRLGPPLLIVNQAGCQCTNALHSVYFRSDLDFSHRSVVVGFLTSLVSTWAELYGRRYGGGVLKLEPGTVTKVPVPMIKDAEYAFGDLDKLLRHGREIDARSEADDLILGKHIGLSRSDIRLLRQAQYNLKDQRRPAT